MMINILRQKTIGKRLMSSLLLRGGTVVNADEQFKADVFVKDGKI